MTHVLTRRNTLRAGAVSVLSSAWIRTARADESGTLTVALSNNLVEFNITGTLRPQLAKALPAISKDSLVYTFDLRDVGRPAPAHRHRARPGHGAIAAGRR